MQLNRRTFLKGLSASALSAASVSVLSTSLASFCASAQSSQDYKALVCVFLYGGMDNHDFILPYDTASYDSFASIRGALIAQHSGRRQRNALLPLNPINSAQFAGRQFALPPELQNIQRLFESGDAAVIGNVGPLIEPVTKQQVQSESVRLPPRLFSHNDQQAVWQASAPEGAQFGWGGLFADAVRELNASKDFTNISTDGSGLFLTGMDTSPYQINESGASRIDLIDEIDDLPTAIRNRLVNHFGNSRIEHSNVIMQDIARMQNSAYAANTSFDQARQGAPALNTVFEENAFAKQLQAVANTIAIKDSLGVSRQVFFVTMGGFDTHDGQASNLPALQTTLDSGINSFQQAMGELGLKQQVTLFTASEFGRTLAVNGDGTDHGWGAHHLVVGGAVRGQRIYGQIPTATFDHEWDAGGGRLIPSMSVEQMAAPLGRWFGLDDAQLITAMPNLTNFTQPELTLFG